MAIQDILAAIEAEAEKRLQQAKKQHQDDAAAMKDASKKRLEEQKQEIAVQKERKKEQMRAKASAHMQMIERNAELSKKQELLDALYDEVVKKLAALPEKDVEALLTKCLKSIKGKGDIHPSEAHAKLLKKLAPESLRVASTIEASGGFIFTSEKEERDFTFEHLVSAYLRPKTEVEIAHSLFTAA